MSFLERGTQASALRGAQAALHASLLGLAALIAALLAHVSLDIAGDYLLSHDSYDDVAHGSRGVFIVAIVALTFGVCARVLFDLVDRRCGSKASLLRLLRCSLGNPVWFAARTMAISVVALVSMELLDCSVEHVTFDGISALFGGSLPLGLSAVLLIAALVGWILHRAVTFVAEREPEILTLISCLMASLRIQDHVRVTKRARTPRSVARSLLLSRSDSKRGPPLPNLRLAFI
jgi:hypothetical protein